MVTFTICQTFSFTGSEKLLKTSEGVFVQRYWYLLLYFTPVSSPVAMELLGQLSLNQCIEISLLLLALLCFLNRYNYQLREVCPRIVLIQPSSFVLTILPGMSPVSQSILEISCICFSSKPRLDTDLHQFHSFHDIMFLYSLIKFAGCF